LPHPNSNLSVRKLTGVAALLSLQADTVLDNFMYKQISFMLWNFSLATLYYTIIYIVT